MWLHGSQTMQSIQGDLKPVTYVAIANCYLSTAETILATLKVVANVTKFTSVEWDIKQLDHADLRQSWSGPYPQSESGPRRKSGRISDDFQNLT